jgi:hypothetical protein
VQAAPARGVHLAVEALDQVHRLRNVVALHPRHRQAEPPRQRHHEPFIDHRVRVGRVRMIGLEDMRRRRPPGRLVQLAILQHHRQLVLGTGQRHALERALDQGDAGHGGDARAQVCVAERPQATLSLLGPRRKQGQRAGGFGPVVAEQAEGIGAIHPGGVGQQHPLAFLGQQVVEVPLHRPPRAAVLLFLGLQGQAGAQGEAAGRL